jgi:hypothetical protein
MSTEKKEPMKPEQKQQFNQMLAGLRQIAKGYQTLKQLEKSSKSEYGLSYVETLEMAYENMQNDAKFYSKGVKPL